MLPTTFPAGAHFSTDAAGAVQGLIDPTNHLYSASSSDKMRINPSKVLKEFKDNNHFTIAASGATVTTTIDMNSPLGKPAVKLSVTGALNGTVDIGFALCNEPAFDDHVQMSVWVDDYTKIQTVRGYLFNNTSFLGSGGSNTGSYNAYPLNLAYGNIGGRRTYTTGPTSGGGTMGSALSNNGAAFVFGTDPLKAYRFRLFTAANANFDIWLDVLEIPARQRPIVSLTWDDDEATWSTLLKPLLLQYNIKATFGINTVDILAGTGGTHITAAQLIALLADGHQGASHGVSDYSLRVMGGRTTADNLGEWQGAGAQANATIAYVTDYMTAVNYLINVIGIPPGHAMYFPWIQGVRETQAMELLASVGCKMIRNAGASELMPYGYKLGNRIFDVQVAWAANSSTTAAFAIQQIQNAQKYGMWAVAEAHNTSGPGGAEDGVTWSTDKWNPVMAYIAQEVAAGRLDCMRAIDVYERFDAMGIIDKPVPGAKRPVRLIGILNHCNLNGTINTDQNITLDPGNWVVTDAFACRVDGNKGGATIGMTNVQGGINSAASKGGTQLVPTNQVFTGLDGTAHGVQAFTINAIANDTIVANTLYYQNSIAQGATALCDIFVFGRPAVDTFEFSASSVITITPPASLAAYTNTTKIRQFFSGTGGVATLYEFGRAGVWTTFGTTDGQTILNPGDQVRVTYSVAPTTMTAVPL